MIRARTLAALLVGGASILLPTLARAEADARTFLERIDRGETPYLYVLNGYANGLEWANTYLGQHGQQKIFCAPDRLAISPEQNVEILRRYVAAEPSVATVPAGLALLLAYRSAYPCPASQS